MLSVVLEDVADLAAQSDDPVFYLIHRPGLIS
jgi:hypothetical protein